MEVEDRLEPEGEGGGLLRTLTMRGGSQRIWFGAAPAGEIVEKGGAWTASGLHMRLRSPRSAETAVVRKDELEHLLIGIDFDARGEATLVMEIEW